MTKNCPIGQGHGIAGRFGGLCNPYGSEETAAVVILPIPFDISSSYKSGSHLGPEALIEASRNVELYDIETDFEPFLKGIYTAPPIIAEDAETMIQETYRRVSKYLDERKLVASLGGEHTVSYGPIKAYAEKYPGLTIVQFDAHADLQEAYEGNPWSHASVMMRVRELPNINRILSIGVRSLSRDEVPFIDRPSTFYAHEIDEGDSWCARFFNAIQGPIYITFDLDAFDSSLMPSTGTPEPGGLQWNQTMRILKKLAATAPIVGFDIVELCPLPHLHAPNYLAAKLLYKILSYIFTSRRRE